MYHWKAKKFHSIFLTRKDFHHKNKRPSNGLVWYKKKKIRKIGNRKVRRYKDYISNCEYKKIYDVQWEIM